MLSKECIINVVRYFPGRAPSLTSKSAEKISQRAKEMRLRSHTDAQWNIETTKFMNNYLESVRRQFEYYKMLAEKTMEQVPEEKLFWQFNEESNSIATIVKHLWGNMLSRWTDFLTTDGEKAWRNRDAEFEHD